MRHRIECGPPDCLPSCGCRCHQWVRCGAPLPRSGEPCWRLAGHSREHRSRWVLEDTERRGRLARARAKWDNDAAEYSGPIAHNAQRPVVRLYSERRGVDIPEYRRNG